MLVSALALFVATDISEVYVADFRTENKESCRPSDVDLSRSQVQDFFGRAKSVEPRVLHDHYDLAPCFIQGTLKYRFRACEWEVRAGATGSITCGKRIEYFVCDTCADLFARNSK
ncbi:MAG: hypothetical protein IPO19_04965 [Rhodoferax sp.]|nr:hypothetical protein [Rhodoferax sp.]MBK9235442.1 hypothetical protein [Rhodoferax sp.]